MKIRVALAQIPVYSDIPKNIAEIRNSIDAAVDGKADILLTPEGSLSGYTHLFDRREAELALDDVTAYARKRGVGLALGTCMYESDGVCYDELRFYLPNGGYAGCHTKTLLCGSLDEKPRGEVEHYGIMPLRVFDYMGVKIGGLVCNDMWANPFCTPQDDTHLARRLAKMGAKIIFHSVNGGRDAGAFSQETCKKFHEVHVLFEAMANKIFIATVDNAYPTDVGVASIGGVASPNGWEMQMKDIGSQMGFYTMDTDALKR